MQGYVKAGAEAINDQIEKKLLPARIVHVMPNEVRHLA
jgi:hypothetical protein